MLISLSTQPNPFCNVAMECTKTFPADLETKRLSYSYQGLDATGMLLMLNNPYHNVPLCVWLDIRLSKWMVLSGWRIQWWIRGSWSTQGSSDKVTLSAITSMFHNIAIVLILHTWNFYDCILWVGLGRRVLFEPLSGRCWHVTWLIAAPGYIPIQYRLVGNRIGIHRCIYMGGVITEDGIEDRCV